LKRWNEETVEFGRAASQPLHRDLADGDAEDQADDTCSQHNWMPQMRGASEMVMTRL
jgi:hypothetical protein